MMAIGKAYQIGSTLDIVLNSPSEIVFVNDETITRSDLEG